MFFYVPGGINCVRLSFVWRTTYVGLIGIRWIMAKCRVMEKFVDVCHKMCDNYFMRF